MKDRFGRRRKSQRVRTAEDILGKPKTTEDKEQKTETDQDNRGQKRAF